MVLVFSQNVGLTTYFQHYSTPVQYEAKYFFLFERASKAAGPMRLFFLNLVSISVQKRTYTHFSRIFKQFFETSTFLWIFFVYQVTL